MRQLYHIPSAVIRTVVRQRVQKGMVLTMTKRLMNIEELCDYVGMGKSYTFKWAKEHGLARKIGRRTLYDKVLVDKLIDDLNKEGENNHA